MGLFCIPKNLVEKLKNSALKGNVDIKKLYEMSSEERRNFFTEYTDETLGKYLNTEFEKAMISKQKAALTDWAKSVFKPEMQTKPVFKTVLDKINSLDEMGVLNPKTEKAFLEDLVSDRLGISVSPDEVRAISERAKKIDDAQIKLGADLGNPEKLEENLAFFKAKKEMDDYLLGRTPASKLKIATGTIGRGMMLASIKSPILNIASNTELAITEALSRRLAGEGFKGGDNKLAMSFVKMANKVYQQTGYDISRMETLRDTGASGERVLGETVHSQGPGMLRKIGRGVENIVFKQLMGAPDVAFSSAHFADSVNINSLRMAKGDKVLASQMMTDAMRIEPQTVAGELLRGQGRLDAQVATWTNTSWASKVSEGVRKVLNDVSGDARVGDYLLPFIKTPANVIATGLDYAGMGIVPVLVDTFKAFKAGELGTKEYRMGVSRHLTRMGLGLVGALVITNQLSEDDFVGAYDPQRAQIEQLRNSNYNAIRVGDKWLSTDWLGPLAVPVTAMMYARKYGRSGPESLFQYGKGLSATVLNIPGISDIYDAVRTNTFQKNQDIESLKGATLDYVSTQAYSRIVPSIFSDLAKVIDPNVRQGGKGFEGIKAKIPFVSMSLPIKTNIFGDPIKGESGIIDILFGSRVKTDKETPLISELARVADATDKGIIFTDWSKSSSKTLAQFKEKVGPVKYDEAKAAYGKELKKELEEVVAKSSYQKLSDEDKLTVLNGKDSDAMEKVFRKYGFKYKRTKSTVPTSL